MDGVFLFATRRWPDPASFPRERVAAPRSKPLLLTLSQLVPSGCDLVVPDPKLFKRRHPASRQAGLGNQSERAITKRRGAPSCSWVSALVAAQVQTHFGPLRFSSVLSGDIRLLTSKRRGDGSRQGHAREKTVDELREMAREKGLRGASD